MNKWKTYVKRGHIEARPYIHGEDMTGISISEVDKATILVEGGMVARDPEDHNDTWFIAKKYFETHYKEV